MRQSRREIAVEEEKKVLAISPGNMKRFFLPLFSQLTELRVYDLPFQSRLGPPNQYVPHISAMISLARKLPPICCPVIFLIDKRKEVSGNQFLCFMVTQREHTAQCLSQPINMCRRFIIRDMILRVALRLNACIGVTSKLFPSLTWSNLKMNPH